MRTIHVLTKLGLAAILAATLLSVLSPRAAASALAATVTTSGAAGVNIAWEQGRSSTWYIEEQRVGADFIALGIQKEDPSIIQQGMTILDWGFNHEGSDGSYTGTSGGFHSTSLFMEGAARAALQLSAYSPSSYALPSGFYSRAVSRYATNLHKTALWMMNPANSVPGQLSNFPYAHRRFLLAAGLAEVGALTGDRDISNAATPYIQDGLTLQLPRGWRAALAVADDGTAPPAVLLSPTDSVPDGATKVISAAGVLPEKNGYDVTYQGVSALMAERYYAYCKDSSIKRPLARLIQSALAWEEHSVGMTGAVDYTGSSRVGQENTRAGTPKVPDIGTIRDAFGGGYAITGVEAFPIVNERIMFGTNIISRTVLADDGAAGGNATWEAGSSSTWQIGWQSVGTEYIEQGIASENDDWIHQGLKIIDWGFRHQVSDGSFAGTDSAYNSTAQFIEAAARAALDLKAYDSDLASGCYNNFYHAKGDQYASKLGAAARWLLAHPASSSARYPSCLYAVAAALGETGVLIGDDSLVAAATPLVTKALSLQASSGANLEDGQAQVGGQAHSLQYAERYYPCCSDASMKASLKTMLTAGLTWESQWVTLTGSVTGTSNPPTHTMPPTFALGAAITGQAKFATVAYRMGWDG